MIAGMRARIVALVAVVALLASAAVVAIASTRANGLPSYTNGYQRWPRLNAKPTRGTPLGRSAHNGVKNVYASKRKAGSRFPNGTVIVKTIVKPGTKYVGQVAVMRKVNGRWRYVEYIRSSSTDRYSFLAGGQLCASCHVQARSNDYVFTKR